MKAAHEDGGKRRGKPGGGRDPVPARADHPDRGEDLLRRGDLVRDDDAGHHGDPVRHDGAARHGDPACHGDAGLREDPDRRGDATHHGDPARHGDAGLREDPDHRADAVLHGERRRDDDLVVDDLTVRFGRHVVLDRLSLCVARGTTTVLLGPNGSGKSTLFRACLGVVRAQSGRVRVLGHDPQRRAGRVLRLVGYVPDKPDVYAWMTVPALFRFLRPHLPTWDADRAAELVERLDVPMAQTFGRMSRGQGMKAMLAAALAPRPAMLLLDEPFGGLDPLVREEVLKNVIGALGDDAPTVLLATHDLEIAARVADRVAVLANGRIRREGPVDEIGGRNVPTPAARRLHETLAVAAEKV